MTLVSLKPDGQLPSDVKVDATTVVQCRDMEPKEIVRFLLNQSVHHLVQGAQEVELKRAEELVLRSQGFFESPEKILLENYRFEKVPFGKKTEKETLFAALDQFFGEKTPTVLQETHQSVLEELYMNAVHSAPKEFMKVKRAIIPPDRNFLTFAESPHHTLIACADSYGALDFRKVLSRMDEVYHEGIESALTLEQDSGAGLGFVILFENASHLILGCIPGRISMVAVLVPRDASIKVRAEVGKSVHLVGVSA